MNYFTGVIDTESKLERAVNKVLKDRGVLCYKFVSPQRRGVPDMLYITPTGRTVFVEYKSPTGNGKLTALQKVQIQKLRDNDADVHVVSTTGQANGVIDYILSLGFLI